MPSVGDIYINLGIKGSEKTVGALTDVKKGMGDITSMSIEAKAAIVGAVYGFEQLMSASGRLGTQLFNTSTVLGIPVDILQKYNFAARQVGATNEEMAGSFKSLSSVMASIKANEGPPKWFAFVASKVGVDFQRAKADIPYLFQKLQQFAQLPDIDKDLKRKFLLPLLGSETILAGTERGAFNKSVFDKAPIQSDSQVKSLYEARRAWENLSITVENAFAKFNAGHGVQIAKDLGTITNSVLRLAEAVTKLAEKLKLFKAFSWLLQGTAVLTEKYADAADAVTNKSGKDKNGKSAFEELAETSILGQLILALKKELTAVAPFSVDGQRIGPLAPVASGTVVHNNFQISHVGDAKDTKSVLDLHKKAAAKAQENQKVQRTSPAQTQTH